MQISTKKASLGLGVASAAVAGLFFLWLFSLEGSRGLGLWGWNRIYLALAALGLGPLVLALAGWLFRGETSKPGAVLAFGALGLAILAIAGFSILFGTIYTKAHRVGGPVPALNLVDPAKGLSPAAQGPEGPVLRLAISSDPHWGAPNAAKAERSAILKSVAAQAPRPDALFILGDNTQMGWNDEEWRAEATELGSALGDLKVRPILGNHDAIVDGQYHFARYFFPKALSTDTGSPFYYSLDAGPAYIVVLDLLWGAEDFTKAKAAWLERTLAAVPKDKRIIVLSHCFFASSGYLEGDEKWYDHEGTLKAVAPILERHKVDLVVQGHNHYMELLKKDGVSYATIGAMGGYPDPEPSHVSPWSLWFRRGTFGYLDLGASAKGIDLTFRDEKGSKVYTAFIQATR